MNYACTYLGNWEQELYSKSRYLPSHYWRYVFAIKVGLEITFANGNVYV
jgi:hypothetical protein